MSYKKLSQYQVNDKVLIPLTKFVVLEPKEANRLIEIVTPKGLIEMVLFNTRGSYGK